MFLKTSTAPKERPTLEMFAIDISDTHFKTRPAAHKRFALWAGFPALSIHRPARHRAALCATAKAKASPAHSRSA